MMLSHDESGTYILRNQDRDRFYILSILIFIRAYLPSQLTN